MSDISATHPDLQLTGRFQCTTNGTLRCAWPGSQIALRFKGTSVDVTIEDFSKEADGNVLAILINDNPPVTLSLKPGRSTYRLTENLAPGEHQLLVFKQTEASVGSIEFTGFTFPDGTLLPPPPKPTRRIEFIGDSITCGYGNESENQDEPFKPSTENHFLSFGQLAARKLGAEAHVVAWSGEGILRNAAGDIVHPLPILYDQTVPPAATPAWDFSKWIPHVVVINLGTNDFLTGIPNREQFISTYLQLLKKIDGLYRSPHTFCCLGPMITDESPEGEDRLTTARSFLLELDDRARENGIPSIYHLEFTTLSQKEFGADWHPNLAAHRRMATTLAEAIQKEIDW